MIALDTNVIARFYVDDPADAEAPKQRPLARALFEDSAALFVPKTVVLELEWVMRAFYDFKPTEFARVIKHLSALSHVIIENRDSVLSALEQHLQGLDFADALHLCSSSHCQKLATFDDKKFARRANRFGLNPTVHLLR